MNLSEVVTASTNALKEQWVKCFKNNPPTKISRKLLEYAVAYQIQLKSYRGGKVKLPELAKPSYKAGTKVIREWHGVVHEVILTKNGAIYNGKSYKSLSAIAKEITGAYWSGPRFFGLNK